MLGDPRHDVLFLGYQAAGASAGRASSNTAHADQQDLLSFVGRMRDKPRQTRLVHGDTGAKDALAGAVRERHPEIAVVVP